MRFDHDNKQICPVYSELLNLWQPNLVCWFNSTNNIEEFGLLFEGEGEGHHEGANPGKNVRACGVF